VDSSQESLTVLEDATVVPHGRPMAELLTEIENVMSFEETRERLKVS
jgi:hypothetical protein